MSEAEWLLSEMKRIRQERNWFWVLGVCSFVALWVNAQDHELNTDSLQAGLLAIESVCAGAWMVFRRDLRMMERRLYRVVWGE